MDKINCFNEKILIVGEIVLDHIGITDKIMSDITTTQLNEINLYYGGRAANAAVASSLLASHPILLGIVGTDFEKSRYLSHLLDFGVVLDFIVRSKTSLTARSFIFSDKDKSVSYYFAGSLLGESPAFCSHVNKTLPHLYNIKAVYCTSANQEVNLLCLNQEHIAFRVYSPAHDLIFHDTASIIKCIEYANILIVNNKEYEYIQNELNANIISLLNNYNLDILIVTKGHSGLTLYVSSGQNEINISSCKNVNCIDGTGAGDCFGAVFTTAYSLGIGLINACYIASSAASFVIEAAGTQTNIPSFQELLHRAEENYGSIDIDNIRKRRGGKLFLPEREG